MILIVGAGNMAQEYSKILKKMNEEFTVVGRSQSSVNKFESVTGICAFSGGLDAFYKAHDISQYETAIVTTSIESLAPVAKSLIEKGVRYLLIEKPAGLDLIEINNLSSFAESYAAEVYVAYNRRFYESVNVAEDIIERDGGVKSFNFELTEWGHVIAGLSKAPGVKENWFLGNTSHVIDLAFFLGGKPKEISTFTSGTSDWHPRSYNYSGAGVSQNGALFSYHGNWGAPGRWSLEILTGSHRLIFRPMEKLQIQELGSVTAELIDIQDYLDVEFKPGLYKQTEAFLERKFEKLCSLAEHSINSRLYSQMANYT